MYRILNLADTLACDLAWLSHSDVRAYINICPHFNTIDMHFFSESCSRTIYSKRSSAKFNHAS